MFCSNCGVKNGEDAKFCFKCGTTLSELDDMKQVSCDEIKSQMKTNGFILLEESDIELKWKNFDTNEIIVIDKTGTACHIKNMKNKSVKIKFSYKPRVLIFFLGILFFGASTFFFGYSAIDNDSMLIINNTIELSVQQATLFYWFFSIASSIFVITATFILIANLFAKKEIVISEEEISVPKHFFSQQNTLIKYSDIININIQIVSKQKFLNIVYKNGKITVPQTMLLNNKEFERLVDLVNIKLK